MRRLVFFFAWFRLFLFCVLFCPKREEGLGAGPG